MDPVLPEHSSYLHDILAKLVWFNHDVATVPKVGLIDQFSLIRYCITSLKARLLIYLKSSSSNSSCVIDLLSSVLDIFHRLCTQLHSCIFTFLSEVLQLYYYFSYCASSANCWHMILQDMGRSFLRHIEGFAKYHYF